MSDSIAHPVIETLKQAADGLLFPSETDAPLEPFFWPQEHNSRLECGSDDSLAGVAADTPIKSTKLATFFRPATKAEEWQTRKRERRSRVFKNWSRRSKMRSMT
jgi:hypothetical protein